MKKTIILLLTLVALVAGYVALKKLTHKSPYEVLEIAEIQRADVQKIIVETGLIKPQVGAQIKIGTRATGTLTGMYVKIGDSVKKNQLIAKIDDREIKKNLVQLKASFKKEGNMLKKINLTYPRQIKEMEKEIASKKAVFQLAEMELKRQIELMDKGYTTQSELDKAETEYKKTSAELGKSQTTLDRLKKEFKSEKKITMSEIERIKATIDKEKVILSYTTIRSPVDGIVSDITAQEGETLVAGLQVANLVTIMMPEKLEMWIYVDETDIGKIKTDMSVHYTVDTYPNKVFFGTINRILPQPVIKDDIVYYLGIVHVQKKDAILLRPEMTTYVKILIEEKKNVVAVPNGALKFENNNYFVYQVIDKKEFVKTPVQIGIRGESLTEISAGLTGGEKVATKLIIRQY